MARVGRSNLAAPNQAVGKSMPPPGGLAADLPGERGGEAADPHAPSRRLRRRPPPASGEVKLLIHRPPPGGFAADLPGERGGEAATCPLPAASPPTSPAS